MTTLELVAFYFTFLIAIPAAIWLFFRTYPVTYRFKHDPWPLNPKYPNAWRGATTLVLSSGKTALRIQWFYAHRENDWMRVDTACQYNISPRWAKWFHLYGYYAGMYRYSCHIVVGHFAVSYIPLSYAGERLFI